MVAIPPTTCFIDRGGDTFLVANWDRRAALDDPAVLVRLSARHRAIHRALTARGRSQKSVYYALFARGAAARPGRRLPPAVRRRATRVPIDLATLPVEELARLANSLLRWPIASLKTLPPADLRDLVRSLYALKG